MPRHTRIGGVGAAILVCMTLLVTVATAHADDVAIGNYRLHIDCEGTGTPAVILDSGLGGSSLEWVFVTERLRGVTRVCTFDRAGYGDSETGPMPRTSSRIANELYLLLDGAGVAGPYIVVGHSFGGYNAQLFARRYPYLTAGLVLIDASHPDQVERFRAPPLGLITAPSSRYGIVQFRDPPPAHAALPSLVRLDIARRAKRWKTRRTLANELLGFRDSGMQVSEAPALQATPLIVLTRGRTEGVIDEKRVLMERLWLTMQAELAASSSASAHLVARNAGHNIHVEQPELAAYAIAMLVERYRRAHDPLPSGSAFVDAGYEHFDVRDVTWLHDTLNLFPATARVHLAACLAEAGQSCVGGAP